MSDSARGGMIVALIVFSLAVYYLLWVAKPAGQNTAPASTEIADTQDPGATAKPSGGGVNYLSMKPIAPNPAKMVTDKPAPDFSYYTIDGREIKLSSFIGQKPVVLDFWATWCGPCRKELPFLQEFYSTHSGQVEIIAITDEDSQASAGVRKLVSDMKLSFPIVHDPSHTIAKMYPTTGIPYLVFIDVNGIVVSTVLGSNPKIGQEIIDTFKLSQ